MSRFGTDYHIARATGVCAATGQPLEPGSVSIATLCERPDDDSFDRRDFSLPAWEAGARPEGLYSYWKTTVPEPDAKPRLLVDDTVLMDLFERLAGDERPQRQAFRFVLALILMRKKLLKFVGRASHPTNPQSPSADTAASETSTNPAPQERWLLQPRGADPTASPIELINPNLTDDDVRDLLDQLSEILKAEL